MRLSILDQSPVVRGHDARRALLETLALARRADTLGYHRYWLAEHHAIAALADPCPELLVARLGAETSRMRVGTGGVLLPYYSAFRTAESFRMLEAVAVGAHDLVAAVRVDEVGEGERHAELGRERAAVVRGPEEPYLRRRGHFRLQP